MKERIQYICIKETGSYYFTVIGNKVFNKSEFGKVEKWRRVTCINS